MKKSWISFICILLCVFIPFAAVASAIIFLPSQFENTFLGALEIKVNRIESIKEPKIVIVGGSSVPFGVDSKQMEEMLGMPVVNFGLYATLGTKLMLDLSREYINEGDIIVIAPETDAQTYSLFFNAEAAWQAADSDYSLLPKIAKDNFAAMLGGAWKFAAQKVKYYRADTKLDPQGIYNVKSFDEYGDITYPREYNKMELLFDSSLEIKLSKDIVSAEFIDYVNEYVEYAEGKGARVMFSFAPMNMDALSPDMTLEQIEEFKGFIKGSFKAELISDLNAYIYESGYFYDSNFHLNDAGTVYHTANLARDIAAALGKEIIKDFEIPEIPEIPGTDIPEPDIPDAPPKTDENEKYFVFEEFKVGGEFKGYNIIGLSELGVEQEILTTPTVYNGEKVYKLKANTFSGSEVTEIYVTDNISSIEDGAFSGADWLQKVHILAENPDSTTVNNMTMGLLDGIAEDVKFYVPADSYDTYVANYFWSPYAFIIYPEISEPGGTTPEDPPQADENEKYFVFAERKVGGELKGYNIIGLSELGKSQEVLTTPKVYNGMRVYNLKANAFSGAAATEIYITDTIASIEDGAFAGAQSLKKVHILAENPDSTTVNNLSMGLCDGMAKDAKFYVPAASYSNYVSNYFWSPYASKITSE